MKSLGTKLRKEKYLQYTRRNKVPETSNLSHLEIIGLDILFPLNIDPTNSSTSNKDVNVYLNGDVTNVSVKVMVYISLSELIEIPSQKERDT